MSAEQVHVPGYSPEQQSMEELLRSAGCLKYGHTVLETGEHASGYLSKEGFLTNPGALYATAERLVSQIPQEYDFVVGPVNFGYMFASYCALVDNKPCSLVFLPHDGERYDTAAGRLHRDFTIPQGKRALLVDDWSVSGQTLDACRQFLALKGCTVAAVGLIGVNQKIAGELRAQPDVTYLLELPFSHHAPDDCPQCRNSEPVQFQGIRE